MLRYFALKVLRGAVTLLVVTVVVFWLSRATGDPVRLMVSADATDADVAAIREQLGLNRSLVHQYWEFLTRLLHGDMGTSIRFGVPNRELITDRLGNTLELALAALLIAVCVAVPAGVLAARRPGGWVERLTNVGVLLGQSVPTFVVGTLLVLVLSVHWQVFPPANKGSLSSFVLPAITLAWFATAAITRITRSSVTHELASPYVTAARSKGLAERSILFRHALRNAGTSILTMIALQLVLFANGAVVVETIFNWPGIGQLTVQAAFARDFPLIQALVVFTATITIVVNLVTDVAYTLIDRRISSGAAS